MATTDQTLTDAVYDAADAFCAAVVSAKNGGLNVWLELQHDDDDKQPPSISIVIERRLKRTRRAPSPSREKP